MNLLDKHRKPQLTTLTDGLMDVTCVLTPVPGSPQYETHEIKRQLNIGKTAGRAIGYCGTNPVLPQLK